MRKVRELASFTYYFQGRFVYQKRLKFDVEPRRTRCMGRFERNLPRCCCSENRIMICLSSHDIHFPVRKPSQPIESPALRLPSQAHQLLPPPPASNNPSAASKVAEYHAARFCYFTLRHTCVPSVRSYFTLKTSRRIMEEKSLPSTPPVALYISIRCKASPVYLARWFLL